MKKFVEVSKKVWEWFNNKKTVIGFLGIKFCELDFAKENISNNNLGLLIWFFTAIGGIGLFHKEWKRKKSITKRVSKNIESVISKKKK